MSKVITSPVKRWKGTVTIYDPLTLPHAEAIEEAMNIELSDGKVWLTVIDKRNLPAVLACVEKWELENFPAPPTVETFPMSPRSDSHKLIDWIWGEILNLYKGDQEIPNE